jgi:hypothetical protein
MHWFAFARTRSREGSASKVANGNPGPAILSRMRTVKKVVWQAVTEAGFIVFLFYSNLLMGEFAHSGLGQKNGLLWAVWNIFTVPNFIIALVAACVGYVFFEYLRNTFGQRIKD